MPDSDARTGSGKQLLLGILADLSTRQVAPDQLAEATRRLRAGLLLHGSTADESFAHARRLAWRSGVDENGELWRQGVATADTNCFLTDIFESIREMPGLEEFIRGKHPGLTSEEYQASEWVLWLIVSSVQMYVQLLAVESDGKLEIEGRIENYSRIYRQHWLDRGLDPEPE